MGYLAASVVGLFAAYLTWRGTRSTNRQTAKAREREGAVAGYEGLVDRLMRDSQDTRERLKGLEDQVKSLTDQLNELAQQKQRADNLIADQQRHIGDLEMLVMRLRRYVRQLREAFAPHGIPPEPEPGLTLDDRT